jgi:DNA-binding response OmpR family regulator
MTSAQTTAEATKTTVLVIESSASHLSYLRIMLTSLEYDVIVATTAEDGLRILAEARPDVVLVSLSLPDSPGTSLLIRLRDLSLAPVVLLAHKGQEGEVVANLEAGAQDYLVKPFQIETLEKRLRTVLKHRVSASSMGSL